MGIEIRNPSADDLRDTVGALYAAFGDSPRGDDFERNRTLMPSDRILAAHDDGRPIGVAAAYPLELTVPGGTLAAAGVTWVGVLPSHRRRGVLRSLMRRQLDDARERGEPLAILWASESAIYGRFGYGIAAPNVTLQAEKDRFRLRDDPEPVGSTRLVTSEEAFELFPPVYERVRLEIPGMFVRTDDHWKLYKLADPEHWRRGAGPKFFAVLELDGRPEGFATYRIKSDWERGIPQSELRVLDAIATSPVATRELWRFLFGIDLVAKIEQWMFDAGSPLFLMVEDARRLHLQLSDGLWLRFVDLEAALNGRSYAGDDELVLEVHDEFCPWNAGRWSVGDGVAKTKKGADLELDARDLASVYLGAFDFHRLAAAERVRELRRGALGRASALFRTTRPPFCPDEF
jgi:predicted acetyltransferase